MLINKFSSSLAETYRFCAFKYWLTYCLELETSGSGKAATTGTIVHQALEWASRLKKKNKINVDPEWLFERSWNEHPHPNLRKFTSKGLSADYKKCKASFFKVVEDRYYNPYNLKIIDAEKWFSLELPGHEWEIKKREHGETKQVRVRGYIDLVHEINSETLEIVDYKSGTRNSPFDAKEMNFYGLTQKLQAKIYFLATKILFPQYKNTVVTFYYTSDGGPTTIGLSDEELPQILNELYNIFKTIESDSLIRRNRSWKCRLCNFNKNDVCGKIWSDLGTVGEGYTRNKYYQLNLENIK